MRLHLASPRSGADRRVGPTAGLLLAGVLFVATVGAVVPAASALPADGNPFGSFDEASPTGTGVRLRGWEIDPDGAPAGVVHVYIDGAPVVALLVTQSRPDVGAAFPYGPDHGFDVSLTTARGAHEACVYGINTGGAGTNVLIGCRGFQVGRSPFGAVDSGLPTPGGVTLVGWAQDPDTPGPINVHVYVDGQPVTAAGAGGDRPDVAAAFGNGAAHGFSVVVPLPEGQHEACVYAIDATGDANALIGCGAVAYSGTPYGHVDYLERSGSNVRVVGWTIDADTAGPLQVQVYVNEQLTVLDADVPRPDVANAYPAYGAAHGVDGVAVVPPSAANGGTFCVWAQNAPGTPGQAAGGCIPFGPGGTPVP
jgi:hypothetical protein